MPLAARLKLLLVLWALLETAAFVLVAHALGVAGALLIGVITTLAGAGLLKRVGAAAVMRLRSSMGKTGTRIDLLDGGMEALAAVALLLPGFISDAIGLALAVPAVRAAAIRRFAGGLRRRGVTGRASRHGPGAIDLSPDEWTVSSRPATGRATPES